MDAPAQKEKIIVLVGPTCVGKTRVAVSLAKTLDAEVVSADSMQVYRGMDIGTAKPGAGDREGVPHHLIDVVDPDEPFDAKRFQEEADRAIGEIRQRDSVPLVVGGTGLYIKSLLHGLFPDHAREKHTTWPRRLDAYRKLGEDPYAILSRVDPDAAAGIRPGDRVRAQRALDVFLRTGRSITVWRAGHGFKEDRYNALVIGLSMDRESLTGRINDRVDGMIRAGLQEEVRKLLDEGFSPELPSMQGIGYRHMAAVLLSGASHAESVERIKVETRQYAKRQMTWFRNQEDVGWFDQPVPDEVILERIQGFLDAR